MSRVVALSVKQPWAWLLVRGLKDVENRSWATRFRGRVLIHASKGMTRKYYEEVQDFLRCNRALMGIGLPHFEELKRGGIIGEVTIVDCVRKGSSPWFFGPFGFVVKDARELPFLECKGALGFFKMGGGR